MRTPLAAPLSLACALLCVACGSEPSAPGYDQGALLRDLADGAIVPAYDAMQRAFEAHTLSVEALCEAPDAARLDAARSSWDDARRAHARVEAFPIGPYDELSTAASLDRSPTAAEAVEALARAGDTDLSQQGANKRGLPAMELLLFDEASADALVAGDAPRCALLVALARDAAQAAARVPAQWRDSDDPYRDVFVSGRDRQGRDILSGLFNKQIATLEVITHTELGKPLGHKVGGTPQPNEAERWRSGASKRELLDNLASFALTYEGVAPALGLSDLVARRDPTLDARMRAAITDARVALEAIPEPLRVAVVESREVVEIAFEACGALLRLFKADVLSALGITLTFNDNDGD